MGAKRADISTAAAHDVLQREEEREKEGESEDGDGVEGRKKGGVGVGVYVCDETGNVGKELNDSVSFPTLSPHTSHTLVIYIRSLSLVVHSLDVNVTMNYKNSERVSLLYENRSPCE